MKIEQFKTLNEPSTLRKGASIDFKCLGNQAFGKCKIQIGNDACTFDGGVKSSDALCSRMTLNNKLPERCLITITDLTEADTGDWSCELDDVLSQTTHLTVNPELAVTTPKLPVTKLEPKPKTSAGVGSHTFVQSNFILCILIVGMFLVQWRYLV